MADVVYTDAFIEDMLSVQLEDKRNEIFQRVDLLSSFPELGSANIPNSIAKRHGDNMRKLVVDPFDVVYEYSPSEDAVYVLGLIHQRAAW